MEYPLENVFLKKCNEVNNVYKFFNLGDGQAVLSLCITQLRHLSLQKFKM